MAYEPIYQSNVEIPGLTPELRDYWLMKVCDVLVIKIRAGGKWVINWGFINKFSARGSPNGTSLTLATTLLFDNQLILTLCEYFHWYLGNG